jgi:hypothetical protein
VSSQPERVLIVTGEIHTGKTTRLIRWIAGRRAAGDTVLGVVAPVINGDRHLCLLDRDASDPCTSLRPSPGDPEVRIGPHLFSGRVFDTARAHLNDSRAYLTDYGTPGNRHAWLIVDEVGPLELRGEGFEPELTTIVRAATGTDRHPFTVVLVVRSRLLESVVSAYGLGGLWSELELR